MRRRVSTLVRATGLFKDTRTTPSRSRGLVNSSFARRLRVEALEDRRMLAGVEGFTGPYALSNWTSSGILDGFTVGLSPTAGDMNAEFSYEVDLPSGGVSQRTADFTLANSLVTGSVTFDYTYTGNHRYHQAEAEFSTVIGNFPQSVVVDSPTSGGFNFSGSASLVAFAGDPFGFRIGGKNFDSSSHIDGALTISNITFHDSLIVDSADDELDFDLSLGNFSLREAVYIANVVPGADKITIAPNLSGQTISLDMGELEITDALTIDATALAENVIVDAQQQSRVMNFSAPTGDMTLSGLTMRNGRTTGDGFSESGGGIRFDSSGTLTLSKIILSENSTIGDNADGGGIFTDSGAVTLINSNVLRNSTTGPNAGGGGIYTGVGNVTLTGSSLSGNSTIGNIASGGGIFTSGGSVILTNSTLSGNNTAGSSSRGGGIRSFYGAVTLNQSTLSGNSTGGATSQGGGIYSNNGVVTLNQSTLTGNGTTGTGANGGGIFVANSGYDPLLTIHNSIVAGNTVGAGSTGPDVVADPGGALTVNFSLIGTGITPTAGGNNISTNTPLLGPLADNDGPTLPNGATILTHALLADSPAINGGDPAVLFNAAEFDQRGAPFVRVVGTRVDMGAVESPYVIVNSAGGGDDGIPTNGITTLREAINLANQTTSIDETILFASNMSGQTILLGGTQLEITESLTIDASALSENVIIDAQQQQQRVMIFSAPTGDLTLSGLTVRNGRTTAEGGSGGGIAFLSNGTLTLTESTVSANSTTGGQANGGGIYAKDGSVVLNQSTVSGNSTLGSQAGGGGIYTEDGDITLNQSTLSGNSSTDGDGGGINTDGGYLTLIQSTLSGNSTINNFRNGGAIYSANRDVTLNQSTVSGNSTAGEGASGGAIYATNGRVTLNHSTLSGNSTAGSNAHGGGIFLLSSFADVTIHNSIVAGNTVAAGSVGPDLMADPGSAITVNYSLIGTGITPTAGGNNISTNTPLLGPLANNGGLTQTHALLPGSPALDAGDPNGANSNAVHIYELNGSLVDELGGPSLVVGGGFLLADGYQFGPNEGPQVSSAVTPDEYSIELVFSFDALGGFQKIIDFQDLADDTGLYSNGTSLDFYGGAFAENVLSPGVPVHLVVTRDAETDVVAVYADGIEVLSFVDGGDIAVFNGITEVVRFFQDDNATGGAEVASGFVDRIRIYDRDLSAVEVAGLVFDQRGVGCDRVADGDGTPGARIDIGAYEAQVNPSADFDGDGDVDGRDFLAWQRGHSLVATATRGDGDSDGDADVDGSDLAAWQGQYGATGLNDLVAVATASDEPMSEPSLQPTLDSASLIDAAMLLAIMDSANEEETSVVIEQETYVNDEVFATSSESALVAPSSGEAESLELTIENATENEEESAPWLSDELLECVFG